MNIPQVCSECYQGITNPICESCYTRQLVTWLHEQGVDRVLIAMVARALKERFPEEDESGSGDACILCGSTSGSICTYCYFFKVERILRSMNLPEPIVDHFLEVFNYKLYSAAYGKTQLDS